MEAIIFDLDGTLVDSAQQIYESVNYTRILREFPEITHQKVREIIGLPAEHLFLDLGVSEQEMRELILVFRERLAELVLIENKLFPGVIETLKHLKSEGFLIGVATSKPGALTKLVIENSLMKPYVDYSQGTDGFPAKPNPEVIRKTIKALGAIKALMIGDRKEDILAATAAGIPSIGIAQSAHTEKQLLNSGASLSYHSMIELYTSIGEVKNLFGRG